MSARATGIWRGLGTVAVFLVAGPVVGGVVMLAHTVLVDLLSDTKMIQERGDWLMAVAVGSAVSTPAALIGGGVMAATSARLGSRLRWFIRSTLVCAALGGVTMMLIIGAAVLTQQSSYPLVAFLARAAVAVLALTLSTAVLGAVCAGATLKLRPKRPSLASADIFD